MHETFSTITAKDIAKKQNVDIATIRLRWNANFGKGRFDSNRELSPEQVEILSRSKREKKTASAKRAPRTWTPESGPNSKEFAEALPAIQKEFSNQPAPVDDATTKPARAKFQWPSFGLSDFLALAVYGHTALVWYELWVIFQVPGILAGIVLFALKHAAVVICRAEKYEDYAADALGVAFVLDGLAVWVHYTAFGDAMPDRFKDGAEFWAALVLGLVVAAGAFATLYFTNKTAKQ